MYSSNSRIPHCGLGRITLIGVLLVPLISAYPWSTPLQRLVSLSALGLIVFLGGWKQGLYFTTLLQRRLVLLTRKSPQGRRPNHRDHDLRASVTLTIAPHESSYTLPVDLLSTYLDRYGLHTKMIRIIHRYHWTSAGVEIEQTWIGLTYSALENLQALQARSAKIPLEETAEIAARRLADHLRELGWDASLTPSEELPCFLHDSNEETWNAVRDQSQGYTSVYQILPDHDFASVLRGLRPSVAEQVWTILELTGSPTNPTVALACILHSDTIPDTSGLAQLGLLCQRGYQRAALQILDPRSTQPMPYHHVQIQQLSQLDLPMRSVSLKH